VGCSWPPAELDLEQYQACLEAPGHSSRQAMFQRSGPLWGPKVGSLEELTDEEMASLGKEDLVHHTACQGQLFRTPACQVVHKDLGTLMAKQHKFQ
ncbi:hypothetical protein J0S82_013642, partial [Galemys pyrenaicus]